MSKLKMRIGSHRSLVVSTQTMISTSSDSLDSMSLRMSYEYNGNTRRSYHAKVKRQYKSVIGYPKQTDT